MADFGRCYPIKSNVRFGSKADIGGTAVYTTTTPLIDEYPRDPNVAVVELV